MLKIKDYIDFKELEKFGFVEKANSIGIEKNVLSEEDGFSGFVIYYDDRIIRNFSCENNSIDIIFDLVQAGLVEKTEEG